MFLPALLEPLPRPATKTIRHAGGDVMSVAPKVGAAVRRMVAALPGKHQAFDDAAWLALLGLAAANPPPVGAGRLAVTLRLAYDDPETSPPAWWSEEPPAGSAFVRGWGLLARLDVRLLAGASTGGRSAAPRAA